MFPIILIVLVLAFFGVAVRVLHWAAHVTVALAVALLFGLSAGLIGAVDGASPLPIGLIAGLAALAGFAGLVKPRLGWDDGPLAGRLLLGMADFVKVDKSPW